MLCDVWLAMYDVGCGSVVGNGFLRASITAHLVDFSNIIKLSYT